MKFSPLFSLLSLVGSAFAAPSALSRRAVTESWGGGIVDGTGWTDVTGTFKIPTLSGQGKKAVSVWVGIDGSTCNSAIIQTGVNVFGDGTLEAWTEWYPADVMSYTNPITVSAGDEIRVSVKATSTTSGTTTMENLTTGKTATQDYTGQATLCQSNAEWIVEDFGDSASGHVELVNFGEVTIYDTSATSPTGSFDPSQARISNMMIDGRQRTNCSASADGVYCSYVA